ncbi:MAG: 5'-nucleotidase C-terminal domain-containing protein [Flavobacteriaceae bacterium]|nr:5'-nucleotidase C-terminal domain-containing protein [Flavobacteriaceae bacterium]
MKKYILIFLTLFLVFSCKTPKLYVSKVEASLTEIKNQTPLNEFEEVIAPYRNKMEKEVNTVLTYTPTTISRRDGKLESSLSNLMADMCYEQANPVFLNRTGKDIDFAMFNYDGLRSDIQKGNITVGNAFELMPFENTLLVLALSGEKMEELIQYLIAEKRAHPVSKQFRLLIKENSYNLTINNIPFDAKKTYYVLTSDYLQGGGDNMNFFKNPIKIIDIDYKLRASIIDYFSKKESITTQLDGRITAE